jgi:elongation factor Ts
MSKLETIKELRALTQAGMKDCSDALQESGGDLQKAVDIIKTKGLNVVSSREGKIASEGMLTLATKGSQLAVLTEVNCQTDFVAKNADFREFANTVAQSVLKQHVAGDVVSLDEVDEQRKSLIATTKENVVVRRWFIEEAINPNARVFSYVHLNNKVGAMLTLLAPSEDAWANPAFLQLGEDLLMQITAMNPAAISVENLPSDIVDRQKTIFENQLREANKPQMQWEKILTGKFNKWYSEVCLLKQESIITPKTSVEQIIKQVSEKLGGEIYIVNFVRCQVGEGLEPKKANNFSQEVAKLSGMTMLLTKEPALLKPNVE